MGNTKPRRSKDDVDYKVKRARSCDLPSTGSSSSAAADPVASGKPVAAPSIASEVINLDAADLELNGPNQEQFEQELRRKLSNVPQVLSENPAEELARFTALVEVRETIAERWMDLLKRKPSLPEAFFHRLVEETKATVANFVEIHHQEIPFCIDPFEKQLMKTLTDPLPHDSSSSTAEKSGASQSGSSAATVVLPHEFQFLVNQKSVWSVCKVQEAVAVDGYRSYCSVAEWWPFRTKFTQWFTKSFEQQLLPLASDMMVSPGHVIRRCVYKGNMAVSEHKLPVDGATSFGILLVVGTLLPSKNLTQEALKACRTLMGTLEEHGKLTELSVILSGRKEVKLQANADGKFSVKDLTPIMKRFQKKLPTECADVTAGEILQSLFRLRSCEQSTGFKNLLLRLSHSWAQMVETNIEKALSPQCPDPTVQARVHPFMQSSRRRGSKALEQSLLLKFQSKGGGYISGKDIKSLEDLGMAASSSRLGSRTCAEFTTRILVKTAEFMQTQDSRILNFCFDTAHVSDEHVLSVVFRSNNVQLAAATQLLPQGLSKEQGSAALVAMGDAMGGVVHKPGHTAPKRCWAWQEFRTSTKNLLMGIANSLKVAMPSDWNLSKTIPVRALVPRSSSVDRIPLIRSEKLMLNLDPEMEFYCCHNFSNGARWNDWYENEDHYKLVFSADEGTEGFIAWLHMQSCSMYTLFWPDMLHLIARRTAMTLVNSGGATLVKKLNRLFRMSRGPWATSKFGKQVQASRNQILASLKSGELPDSMIQAVLPGCARDAGQPLSTFGTHDLAGQFLSKSGNVHLNPTVHKDTRWFSFYDHSLSLDAVWHSELLSHSFNWFSQGTSPWSLSSEGADTGNESYSSRVFAYNVLADDTNQDMMRSLLVVFRPLRAYASQYDRDLQRYSNASVKHALSLVSGKRVVNLIRKLGNAHVLH
ncbi:unnamed protein product [Cladocopium goreaui]|uniref:Uncharacterized protein n=1 Tax=Cladocopium goreaui TaxID=2562237 RepID=A0A9P1C001_9DINO|nr:unnamed protein product [Cladocopium goreaui]